MSKDASSQQVIQGADVARFRNDSQANVQSQLQESFGDFETALHERQELERIEGERKERVEIENGCAIYQRYCRGSTPRDVQSAKIFARFDPEITSPQPCEFYQFTDSEHSKYGYF